MFGLESGNHRPCASRHYTSSGGQTWTDEEFRAKRSSTLGAGTGIVIGMQDGLANISGEHRVADAVEQE